eukprot:3426071-Prymnesium_polylepis.2
MGGDQMGGDQEGGDQEGGDQEGGDQGGGDQEGGDQGGGGRRTGRCGKEGTVGRAEPQRRQFPRAAGRLERFATRPTCAARPATPKNGPTAARRLEERGRTESENLGRVGTSGSFH